MTNIQKLSKTTLDKKSKPLFAKILLRDIERFPKRAAEFRIIAALMEVEHLIKPSILN